MSGCKYCDNCHEGDGIFRDGNKGVRILRLKSKYELILYTYYDDNIFRSIIDIQYCLFCGKKLEVEE